MIPQSKAKIRLWKILAILAGSFGVVLWVAALVPTRPEVSMTLLEYKQWPHGAMFRLSNETKGTISYRAELDGGTPFIRIKTLDGGEVSKTYGLFTSRDLEPGKHVDFFVRLEPGDSPKRFGVMCDLPRGSISLGLESWLIRVKRYLGINGPILIKQTEVWYSRPLSLPSSQQSATRI